MPSSSMSTRSLSSYAASCSSSSSGTTTTRPRRLALVLPLSWAAYCCACASSSKFSSGARYWSSTLYPTSSSKGLKSALRTSASSSRKGSSVKSSKMLCAASRAMPSPTGERRYSTWQRCHICASPASAMYSSVGGTANSSASSHPPKDGSTSSTSCRWAFLKCDCASSIAASVRGATSPWPTTSPGAGVGACCEASYGRPSSATPWVALPSPSALSTFCPTSSNRAWRSASSASASSATAESSSPTMGAAAPRSSSASPSMPAPRVLSGASPLKDLRTPLSAAAARASASVTCRPPTRSVVGMSMCILASSRASTSSDVGPRSARIFALNPSETESSGLGVPSSKYSSARTASSMTKLPFSSQRALSRWASVSDSQRASA
mmetsp:Transcript_1531/g.6036  ORF Transcript_1531/g.6036 Transcript_1531/m.6036 type:complete len:381 (+) Transcript_1531:3383-4525(+)